jgi:hypothetical protein
VSDRHHGPADQEPSDQEPAPEDPDVAEAARIRAARLRAMGGVLRDVSSDETPAGWGETASGADEGARDADLRRQVPPHHGG